MKYKVTLGRSRKELTIETPMNIDQVLLMVADQYGDEWYGCCVSCPETNSFIAQAVEEYYTGKLEDGSDDPYYEFDDEHRKWTVYQWAMHNYCNNLKYRMGHYISTSNPYEEEVRICPTENVFTEASAPAVEKLTAFDIMDYASDKGSKAAADLLLLAGPDGFDGDYDQYTHLMNKLEEASK